MMFYVTISNDQIRLMFYVIISHDQIRLIFYVIVSNDKSKISVVYNYFERLHWIDILCN